MLENTNKQKFQESVAQLVLSKASAGTVIADKQDIIGGIQEANIEFKGLNANSYVPKQYGVMTAKSNERAQADYDEAARLAKFLKKGKTQSSLSKKCDLSKGEKKKLQKEEAKKGQATAKQNRWDAEHILLGLQYVQNYISLPFSSDNFNGQAVVDSEFVQQWLAIIKRKRNAATTCELNDFVVRIFDKCSKSSDKAFQFKPDKTNASILNKKWGPAPHSKVREDRLFVEDKKELIEGNQAPRILISNSDLLELHRQVSGVYVNTCWSSTQDDRVLLYLFRLVTWLIFHNYTSRCQARVLEYCCTHFQHMHETAVMKAAKAKTNQEQYSETNFSLTGSTKPPQREIVSIIWSVRRVGPEGDDHASEFGQLFLEGVLAQHKKLAPAVQKRRNAWEMGCISNDTLVLFLICCPSRQNAGKLEVSGMFDRDREYADSDRHELYAWTENLWQQFSGEQRFFLLLRYMCTRNDPKAAKIPNSEILHSLHIFKEVDFVEVLGQFDVSDLSHDVCAEFLVDWLSDVESKVWEKTFPTVLFLHCFQTQDAFNDIVEQFEVKFTGEDERKVFRKIVASAFALKWVSMTIQSVRQTLNRAVPHIYLYPIHFMDALDKFVAHDNLPKLSYMTYVVIGIVKFEYTWSVDEFYQRLAQIDSKIFDPQALVMLKRWDIGSGNLDKYENSSQFTHQLGTLQQKGVALASIQNIDSFRTSVGHVAMGSQDEHILINNALRFTKMVELLRPTIGLLLGIASPGHLTNYNLNYLQIFVCADILALQQKLYDGQPAPVQSVLAILTAGQGKTVIIMLLVYYRLVELCSGRKSTYYTNSLAAYTAGKYWTMDKIKEHLERDIIQTKYLRFLFIVCNKSLLEGMEESLQKFFGPICTLEYITFNVFDLSSQPLAEHYLNQFGDGQMYVDEADYCLDNFFHQRNQNIPSGLVMMTTRCAVYFTATATEQDMELFTSVLCVGAVRKYPSLAVVVKNEKVMSSIDDYKQCDWKGVREPDDLMKRLNSTLIAEYKKSSKIIVFSEQHQIITEYIEALCGKGNNIHFVVVSNEGQIAEIKKLPGPAVICFDPEVAGRGVDLTISTSPMYVINVCTNDFSSRKDVKTSFGTKQLYQHLGRSNRMRGPHKGLVLALTGNVLSQGQQLGIGQMKLKDRSAQMCNAMKYLAYLVREKPNAEFPGNFLYFRAHLADDGYDTSCYTKSDNRMLTLKKGMPKLGDYFPEFSTMLRKPQKMVNNKMKNISKGGWTDGTGTMMKETKKNQI